MLQLRMADVNYGSEGHEECALAFSANRDPGWNWSWRIDSGFFEQSDIGRIVFVRARGLMAVNAHFR